MAWAKLTWRITSDVAKDAADDKITTLAAALAFYTMLSMAPLLVVTIAIVGAFVGEGHAREDIFHRLQLVMGHDTATLAQRVLQSARQSHHGTLAVGLGLAALLFGATTVFSQLQDSLNTIWKVTSKPGTSAIVTIVRKRLLTFLAMLAIGAVLLASMLISSLLSVIRHFLSGGVPVWWPFWHAVGQTVAFAVSMVLFGAIYKTLPDVKLSWRHVWLGSFFTAALFALGKFAIGTYIAHSGAASTYGAAGSLVVLLLWVYYSSIIFLLGAEFIHAYARHRGQQIEPSRGAVKVGKAQPLPPENGKAH